MNVRKPVDYSAMFEALDQLQAADLPQMELYREIGRVVSERPEKGAAVAAAEYLQSACPAAAGFSPRNLRRMREFYRTYESTPETLAAAMTIGWTQNVVILEAELTLPERGWYIQAVQRFGWSKLELLRNIASNAHQEIALDLPNEMCYTGENSTTSECMSHDENHFYLPWEICRSPMAEFVMKDLVKKAGLESEFYIESAATSTEELGNPVYPPARRKLAEHGIDCTGKTARQLTNSDYDRFDLLIGMDRENLRNMHRICGGDFYDRFHLLMDFTERHGEVADPWYTEHFEATWRDVLDGCKGLLRDVCPDA